jgi:hypothetical protein
MRVHSGFRVHHVCNENANVMIGLSIGADVTLEKPVLIGSLAPDLPAGPIPYRIDRRQKRLVK